MSEVCLPYGASALWHVCFAARLPCGASASRYVCFAARLPCGVPALWHVCLVARLLCVRSCLRWVCLPYGARLPAVPLSVGSPSVRWLSSALSLRRGPRSSRLALCSRLRRPHPWGSAVVVFVLRPRVSAFGWSGVELTFATPSRLWGSCPCGGRLSPWACVRACAAPMWRAVVYGAATGKVARVPVLRLLTVPCLPCCAVSTWCRAVSMCHAVSTCRAAPA